ncbi:hypothetical protein QFC20_006211 [Naganishia adeliensis]|uniref:Uncharacterized protein n=1 Tax=Naganishia adeliensis TaxID=92952 RepID=A0ACC2VDJ6_9TREE|nr:hypothetical protein QFC20_006211 [Naganishia adeliensis]
MPSQPTEPSPRGIQLSRSVREAIAPPIPKAQAWAASYTPPPNTSASHFQSAGADSNTEKDTGELLNLSQGVPGDPPHPLLLASLAQTSADPQSAGYGPILGERALREAVCGEMEFVYQWNGNGDTSRRDDGERQASGEDGGAAGVDAIGEEGTVSSVPAPTQGEGPPTWEEVAITSGCNQAFFNTVMALCDRGDKVMIPVPWYFNMLMTFQILGIQPLPLPLDPSNSFLPSITAARDLLDSSEGHDVKAIVLVTPNNPTGTTYPPGLISQFADLARERGVVLLVDETYRDFICAPRPPQLALAPLLPALRQDLSSTSDRLFDRLELFARLVTSVRGWSVSAQGGFFSYVRHPYIQDGKAPVPSERVSEVLAKRCGVVTLPGSFFMPERGSSEWRSLEEQASPLVEDRWIRFAVANVSDEVVSKVPGRLEMLNGLAGELGWTVEDD